MESLMRILALTILAATTALVAAPACAQTYDPNYPICLHVYGRLSYIDCGYTTLDQCKQSASGRPAMCEINPFFARAGVEATVRQRRRHHQANQG
jgi:hypothetical protein